MREDEIRWKNEKYYYCEQYIWSLRKEWKECIIPCCFVVLMLAISWMIRKLLLTQLFFEQAAEILLEDDMDVMRWINIKIKENQWDVMEVIIIAIAVLVLASIVVPRLVIRSYDLYKITWIRAVPVVLYGLEMAILLIYYRAANLAILIAALIFKFIPVLASSRLLYPLESRPRAKDDSGFWTMLFDGISSIIINKL